MIPQQDVMIIIAEQVQLYFQEAYLSLNLRSFDTDTKQYKKVDQILENLPKSEQSLKGFCWFLLKSIVNDSLTVAKLQILGFVAIQFHLYLAI